ncbi:MAG TPA: hypothetical protein VHC45_07470 [Gaiellaceae bacterium]|nr:hypothetical protein [Gaiellaceae bacterium]
MAVLGALAAASGGGRDATAALALGGAGAALLAVAASLRRTWLVPWALVASAAGYLTGRHGVGVSTALAACALLLAGELAYLSIDDDRRIAVESDVTVHRAAAIGGLVVAAFGVDLLLDAATSLRGPSGVLLATIGVAAAVGALSVVVALARRA